MGTDLYMDMYSGYYFIPVLPSRADERSIASRGTVHSSRAPRALLRPCVVGKVALRARQTVLQAARAVVATATGLGALSSTQTLITCEW